VFRRDGLDVRSEHMIGFPQAALGAVLEIATLDGPIHMRIPEGTQPGQVFRIRGRVSRRPRARRHRAAIIWSTSRSPCRPS